RSARAGTRRARSPDDSCPPHLRPSRRRAARRRERARRETSRTLRRAAGEPRLVNIAFFGSSLVSAYWNGAATYYRGIVRALAERGHDITFYEPDAYGRQEHRDIDDPSWARVVVYEGEGESGVSRGLESARSAD